MSATAAHPKMFGAITLIQVIFFGFNHAQLPISSLDYEFELPIEIHLSTSQTLFYQQHDILGGPGIVPGFE